MELIAQDVTYSINRMKNDKKSLQQSNFVDVTETQAVDDFTSSLPPKCQTRSFSIVCIIDFCQ